MARGWHSAGKLSHKLALAFFVFGAALTFGFGLSMTLALKSVESGMLNDTLHAELAHFRQRTRQAHDSGEFNSRTTVIHVSSPHEPKTLPQHLKDLPVGTSDIIYQGREYRVLVEQVGDVKYTVQYDETSIRDRDNNFIRLVVWSSLVVLLLALATGWYLARRLGRPISHLTSQLEYLKNNPRASLDLSSYHDDEVGTLANGLNHYHLELRALLDREKEFAGNVSHELRTPVTNISLAAEVLASKSGLSPQDADRVRRIRRATREMSELVDTFLVLAQIDQKNEKQFSSCRLKPIVKDVIDQQKVWLGDKEVAVKLVHNAEAYVAAPPRVISVLVANLVRNAFRYTRKGSVTVTVDEHQLTVKDTGIGIDLPTQSHLFERHARGDTGDGAGLGLAIVERICQRYGWQVSFESSQGRGSLFRVDFKPDPAAA